MTTIDLKGTDLPEVHKALITSAMDNLAEFCLSEEPANLDEAIRCLRVLRFYISEEPNPPTLG